MIIRTQRRHTQRATRVVNRSESRHPVTVQQRRIDDVRAVVVTRHRRILIVLAMAVATLASAQPIYWCPMHPEVRGKAGDTCPICRMALVAAPAANYDAYQLDVDITPAAIRPGQHAHVHFAVRDPHTA